MLARRRRRWANINLTLCLPGMPTKESCKEPSRHSIGLTLFQCQAITWEVVSVSSQTSWSIVLVGWETHTNWAWWHFAINSPHAAIQCVPLRLPPYQVPALSGIVYQWFNFPPHICSERIWLPSCFSFCYIQLHCCQVVKNVGYSMKPFYA